MNIRTRFAPSPTGYMHVGGARTALFAWLLARQNNGQFILRIEDTDKAREVRGAIAHIEKSLTWLGLKWDEGPDIGGPFEPYQQSDRLNIYQIWAQKLIDNDRAYADPYSLKELAALRDRAKTSQHPFLFRDYRPKKPPAWTGHEPLRFKSQPKKYTWHDEVMGDLSSSEEAIDDFIIMKPDGYPTYNFCHIVDDYLMQITHIIRSQEFISSVPKYLNLYEALGLIPPIMVTLPFVLANDGRKKLSKRDGAKDILDYAKEGFLAEAMLNFLATLGWNDGTEQELFSATEIITKFQLSHVQKAGARFDNQRLLWMNGQWIRKISLDSLLTKVDDYWPKSADNFNSNYKKQVLGLVQDRLKVLSELPGLCRFFFEEPDPDIQLIINNQNLNRLEAKTLVKLLRTVYQKLNQIDFTIDSLTEELNNLLIDTGQKPAVLFSLIRIATTWAPASPGLAQSLCLLGKQRSQKRLKQAIQLLLT